MGGRGSSSRITKGIRISMQYFAAKRPAVRLPKKEYGKITHEINTVYHEKYSKGGVFTHYSGDDKYQIKVNGYNDYVILGKKRIK
jgi:hypothetical protein